MTDQAVSQAIVQQLPFLRRYARALCGDQTAGDAIVRTVLEVIVNDRGVVSAADDTRVQLYGLFHKIWRSAGAISSLPEDANTEIQRRVDSLPPTDRQALLLTAMEGFSIGEAARILDLGEGETATLVDAARTTMAQQDATAVLIIEDEPIIGLDIANIVESMGHRVVGVATTQSEAEDLARVKRPGLVLADIQLADGSSGIDAAKGILEEMDVPVVFITAYPERLLTGQRPEPTYLVTKPFAADTVKVTIAQALFFRQASPVAA